GCDQSIQIIRERRPGHRRRQLPVPAQTHGGEGGRRHRGARRAARRGPAGQGRHHGRAGLPARRGLRRPAAGRRPAVDAHDADARGDTRVRRRAGHRGQLDRRPGQRVHRRRRAGVLPRDGRVRPHREGRHARPAAAADCWFRFSAGGTDSPVARTRTAPAADAAVTGLRFGVVSCSNYEAGHFSAYRHLAARGDLDAWLHLGDYIYEYGTGEYGNRGRAVRTQAPAHEIVTLADYRVRHAHYKTDPDLQALHAKAPVVAIWDDHEFANDTWSGGAENHTEGAEGAWAARQAAAKQ